ncbi:Hypothetical protein RG1141_CH01640 [Neorhizobium galegae bv. officinalis bv. officinalis str. HAMBI 1141]|uniref:Uncharacterized protein n=1 Tax=Neorhizobium galegae bv. officinalis bv. officinalis str. HAMBI 1141 TaxID=1028801 RepID=A0A068T348_NEOGA|nr:hypothetical protein [Neorhizobium galegae]CDN52529.1 Hypothetical protein RG1141_CH01640 [Neorhizobium galegae bv. officinalis bv. officinalis str. HAMBI 1141]
MNLNAMLSEQVKFVEGLLGVTPSTSTPDYVSLKNFERCAVIVLVKNATTVTGSAITLKQATTVAGGSEKALPFSKAYRNVDTGAGDALSEFAVTSDTFTTQAVNSKNAMYVMEVKAEDLDVNNGFDCIRAGTGDATATTITVLYALYGSKFATTVAAITD